MSELLSVEGVFTLAMLVFLQAVLGFDNLLYVSIESRRAPPEHQDRVRRNGVLIAIAMRLVLLFVMLSLLENLTQVLFSINLSFMKG
ncbi:MAG: tellurium resistance protein TerC, partial [Myxococcota bacterium]